MQHLENYQRNKLQEQRPLARNASPISSLDTTSVNVDTRKSSISPITSTGDTKKSDTEATATGGGVSRHLRQGQVIKSSSFDVSKASTNEPTNKLFYSMSVDRLLDRSDSMDEKELRKTFRELVIEFERLKNEFREKEENEKENLQNWIRTERQFQRKISELEEENKQIEKFKIDIERLKQERGSLIRVISRLTKQN